MPRVIKKNKSNPWNDVLGGIGQGLSGFAKGYMGKQQMDMAKENSGAMRDMMGRMFGKNGENINTEYGNALDSTLGGAGQIPAPDGGMAGAAAQTPALAPPGGGMTSGGMGMNMGALSLEDLMKQMNLGGMGGF